MTQESEKESKKKMGNTYNLGFVRRLLVLARGSGLTHRWFSLCLQNKLGVSWFSLRYLMHDLKGISYPYLLVVVSIPQGL